MTCWSVALFGHEKPKYYVQDIVTGINQSSWVEHPGEMPAGLRVHSVVGWERRAEPGDVVDFKPERCWTCDDQQHSEILGMLKSRAYLMDRKAEIKETYLANKRKYSWRPAARFERIWRDRFLKFGLSDPALLPAEIRGYFSFLPGASLYHLRGADVWGEAERRLFLVVGLAGIEAEQIPGAVEPCWDLSSYPKYAPAPRARFAADMGARDSDEVYQEYVQAEKERCSMPAAYTKKRRHNIPLDELAGAGVDLDRMMDPNAKYVPDVGFIKTDCFDKKNGRKVLAGAALNTIAPIDPEGGVDGLL